MRGSTGTANINSPFSGGGLNGPVGVAVDGAGNIWTANFNSTSISEFKSTGAPISGSNGFKGGGLSAPAIVEIDGSGDVWVTSTSTNTMAEFIGAAAPVVTPVVANLAAPYGAHAVNKP